MRSAGLALSALATVACGDDGGRPTTSRALGRIAYVEAGTRDLVVLEIGSGIRTTLQGLGGGIGGVALEPGGPHIGFSTRLGSGSDSRVVIGDLRSRSTHEVAPTTGSAGGVVWGTGGWFSYNHFQGELGRRVAGADDAESRLMPEGVGPLLHSPSAGMFVAGECTGPRPPGDSCPAELVLQDVTGAQRTVLASAGTGGFWPLAFTSEGGVLVTYEDRDGRHLIARDLVTGDDGVDLGAFESDLEVGSRGEGLSVLSPDGSEVLTSDRTAVIAVKLDGAGQRVAVPGFVDRGGFTGRGDVLYERSTNLTPGSDTPEYAYDLFVARAGEQVRLLEDARSCWNGAGASASGRYVAWPCAQGTVVFDMEQLVELAVFPFGFVIGFTADDSGIIVAEPSEIGAYSLHLRSYGGGDLELGDVAYEGDYPPFDYDPTTFAE